jgi:arsenate reductase
VSDVTLWHNPRCTKSRETLALLEAKGAKPTVVLYLETPPSAEELARVLDLLGIEPRELMRKKEPAYREAKLDDPELGKKALIDAMVKHPILIERPVVLAKGRAVIGRPPTNVLELIER